MKIEEFQDILYQKDDETGIVYVTLNRPERKNAFSHLTFLEIFYAVEFMEKDDTAYAMILTGAKDAKVNDPENEYFSSGGYFSPNVLDGVSEELRKEIDFQDIAQKKLAVRMWQFNKPVIAAINGISIGAGFTLPLCCADLIYASENAWFRLPFVKMGIIPEFSVTYLLPRLIGFQKAKEMIYFGNDVTAQELFNLGIINKVLPHDQLLGHAKEMTLKLIPPKGAGSAVKRAKGAMHEPLLEEISSALDMENSGLNASLATGDFFEGMAARREKREPVYTGK